MRTLTGDLVYVIGIRNIMFEAHCALHTLNDSKSRAFEAGRKLLIRYTFAALTPAPLPAYWDLIEYFTSLVEINSLYRVILQSQSATNRPSLNSRVTRKVVSRPVLAPARLP